jgi:hypothetical protein
MMKEEKEYCDIRTEENELIKAEMNHSLGKDLASENLESRSHSNSSRHEVEVNSSRLLYHSSSPDKSTDNQKYVLLKQELGSGITFIKNLLNKRRKESQKEIEQATERCKEKEKNIRAIAEKHFTQWRKIKDMSSFMGLLRRSIRYTRNFGLRVLRNYEVSHQAASRLVKRKRFTIHPSSPANLLRSVLNLVVTKYLLFILPLDMCFEFIDLSPTLKTLEVIAIFVYLASMGLKFFILREESGMTINHGASNTKRYLLGWFFFDLLSIIPLFELLFGVTIPSKQLFLLPQVLKNTYYFHTIVFTSKKCFGITHEKVKNFFRLHNLAYFSSVVLLSFIFIHTTACLWLFICRQSSNQWLSQ